MKEKNFFMIGLIGIFSLIVGGCAPQVTPTSVVTVETQAPTAAVITQAPEGPPKGGIAVLIIPEEPANLNYYLAEAAIVQQVSDATSSVGLTTVDENGEFRPELAVELPTLDNGGLSADLKTVTWKLKPGLKWSDGEPITSDDIKFTWEVLSNPDSGALTTEGFFEIEAVDTPDELTAVVHYKTPYPGYLNQFAHGIFPRHAAGSPNTMISWEWNRKPVGAGPFVVTEWISGDSVIMERNPYYYEEGKPYLDKLIFKIVPEPAAQTAMMMRGEAHVHLWPGEAEDEYNQLLKGVGKMVLFPGIWNMALDFNLSKPFDGDAGPTPPHPILGDIRVRQAIAHAIDYDTLVEVIPNVTPSTNIFAYGWYQCDLPRKYLYDPEEANRLLEEAGWVIGPDGIRVAQNAMYAENGTRLSLELQGYTNFEPLQRTEEFIVENLKAVGIEARIQNYDFSIIFGSYADGSPRKLGDFDMLIFDRGLQIEPHAYVEKNWSSKNIPSPQNPDGSNVYRWINPEADAAIEEAGSTFDLAKRKEAYCRLAKAMMEDLPQVYLYLFADGYGFSDKLQGYTVSTWGSMTWSVEDWYLLP
jgi:peptide/nickel transport system substrate-binding protein